MNLIAQAIIVGSLLLFSGKDEIVGKWQSKPSAKGNVTGVVFKSDSSFEAFINRKPFTSGRYTATDGTLSFVDNGCNGMRAEYRLVFFSNGDSLRFQPINDSCADRRNGMSKLIVGRIK